MAFTSSLTIKNLNYTQTPTEEFQIDEIYVDNLIASLVDNPGTDNSTSSKSSGYFMNQGDSQNKLNSYLKEMFEDEECFVIGEITKRGYPHFFGEIKYMKIKDKLYDFQPFNDGSYTNFFLRNDDYKFSIWDGTWNTGTLISGIVEASVPREIKKRHFFVINPDSVTKLEEVPEVPTETQLLPSKSCFKLDNKLFLPKEYIGHYKNKIQEVQKVIKKGKEYDEKLQKFEEVISIAKTKVDELATKKENISNDIEKLELRKGQIKTDLDDLSPQRDRLKAEIGSLESKRDILAPKVEELKLMKETLNNYGFLLPNSNDSDSHLDDLQPLPEHLDEQLEYLRNTIYAKSNGVYVYSKQILKNMLTAVWSQQLIILAGATGSGKTSLIRNFAKATGYEAAIIPVQSNWTDKSDLLGYYNPIKGSYEPTTFLEHLLQYINLAQSYPDRLFFLCLDEMNLSHVEYYFADFLSGLQMPERKIELYSHSLIQDVLNELQIFGLNLQANSESVDTIADKLATITSFEERKQLLSLKQRLEKLLKYPPYIVVPKNIKLVGTINKDATTKDLSPKVIDRSYFIRIESNVDTANKEDLDINYSKAGNYYLSYSSEIGSVDVVHYKMLDDTKTRFQNSTNLNNRFDNAARSISSHIVKLATEQSYTSDEFLDFVISGLILPKLYGPRNKIEAVLNDYGITQQKFPVSYYVKEHMLQGLDDDDDVTYWRE